MAEYYANNGDTVYVVTREKKDCKYVHNNVNVIRIGANNDINNIESVKKYRKKVSKILNRLQNDNKIDIIETPDWGANTIYFEKYRKVPLVVRLHTPLKIWLNYNNNNFGAAKDLLLKWEEIILKNADSLISCSELLKREITKQYNINNKIIVIPNPYNHKDFKVITQKDNNNLIYVGSLEERKGVILLAKSLNKIFNKIDDVYIYIVGKDTKRNSKNISTKEYMLKLIDKKYHHRVNFIGQVSNNKVNKYLNNAYLAIFPSLFDNFPYVILEAMACGKHIICSNNIGSVDLIKKNNYIFRTNNLMDLEDKILLALNNKKEFINYANMEMVNNVCNQKYICEKMRRIYLDTIEKYNEERYIVLALKSVIRFSKIKKIEIVPENLANIVYYVFTDVGDYVVKKYNYNYDFNLCDKLYNLYKLNNIKHVEPINKKIIVINNKRYNIFKYLKPSSGKLNISYIKNILNIDRKIDIESNILDKCNKYYDYLYNLSSYNILIANDIKYVIQLYKDIKDIELFKDKYLNHGDLSFSNIIFHGNDPYVIDFDEACITTKIYDYAVVFIKIYINNMEINNNNIINCIIKTMPDNSYSIKQYLIVIKFYLCKILLEKFYLYENKKIDLFSECQLRDNYNKYMKMLKEISRCEESYE